MVLFHKNQFICHQFQLSLIYLSASVTFQRSTPEVLYRQISIWIGIVATKAHITVTLEYARNKQILWNTAHDNTIETMHWFYLPIKASTGSGNDRPMNPLRLFLNEFTLLSRVTMVCSWAFNNKKLSYSHIREFVVSINTIHPALVEVNERT